MTISRTSRGKQLARTDTSKVEVLSSKISPPSAITLTEQSSYLLDTSWWVSEQLLQPTHPPTSHTHNHHQEKKMKMNREVVP